MASLEQPHIIPVENSESLVAGVLPEQRVGSETLYQDAAFYDEAGAGYDANGEQIFAQTPDERSVLVGAHSIRLTDGLLGRSGMTHAEAVQLAAQRLNETKAEEAARSRAEQAGKTELRERTEEQRTFDALPRSEQSRLREEEKAWRTELDRKLGYRHESDYLADIEMYDLGDEAAPKELATEEAVQLLSYADVLEGDTRKDAIRYTETSQSGQRYTEALQDMVRQIGVTKISKLAEALRTQCLAGMADLGLQPSEFSRSLSWAYWDLAKQRYFAVHPEETTQEYSAQDPIENNERGVAKRKEIVHRQIGWEISRLVKSGELSDASRWTNGIMWADGGVAVPDRNETGQLHSYLLAEIGHTALQSQVQLAA